MMVNMLQKSILNRINELYFAGSMEGGNAVLTVPVLQGLCQSLHPRSVITCCSISIIVPSAPTVPI